MLSTLKTAFVVGYTGATGNELVKKLVTSNRFEKVVLIGRRKVEYDQPELKELEQKVVDFEKLDDFKETFKDLDVGFCCLGTTRKDAGSAEAFRHVDFDYVQQVAVHCKEGGTKHFHYVSSGGADKNSMFLYNKTKGEVEEALKEIGFERLSIYRPLLLVGRESRRPLEQFLSCLGKPVLALKPVLLSTHCNLLAKCMINNCDTETISSVETLYNRDIYRVGGYYNTI